ncbi:MAG: hypothetical protein OXM61_10165 [Candidatus Poribacteria bacterium]|nr:hypothetical protein [Candidatus Poribacteria bacterium]
MSKRLFLILAILATTVSILGCGTDVKPNYFIGMFRDEGDIDRLSECLVETPSVEGDIITIKADSPCLVDLSKRDTSDPNMDVSFSEILNDPEQYLDKILTFEAIVKKMHNVHHVELYTNRKGMTFHIISHGADIHTLDEDGEEEDIVPNRKYKFKIRIYQLTTHADWNGRWQIHSEFIITQNKKIVHLPVPVEGK